MKYDVAGLGNAIVDVLVRFPDDTLLQQLKLTRGIMHPVSHEEWQRTYLEVKGLGAEVHSGGSGANTLCAVGLAGKKALFCGQVGDDQFGAMYADSLKRACGEHSLRVEPGAFTGKCLSLISMRDAERTMCTHLGAAVDLPELGPFAQHILESKVLHIEGYLLLGDRTADVAFDAMARAKAAGVMVSIDASDPFVVNTVPDRMWRAAKDYATVVFLNADEASGMTGLPPAEAVHAVAEQVPIVVVKLGREGSLIKHKDEVHRVGIHAVKAIDTTGAGDAYAGGFLVGLCSGWDLARCGDLGARFASLTVGQIGAVCREPGALSRAVAAASAGATAGATS